MTEVSLKSDNCLYWIVSQKETSSRPKFFDWTRSSVKYHRAKDFSYLRNYSIFAFFSRRDNNTQRLYWLPRTMMTASYLRIPWSLLPNFNINLEVTLLKRILCSFVWKVRLDTELENLWAKWLKNPLTFSPFWLKLWITSTKLSIRLIFK